LIVIIIIGFFQDRIFTFFDTRKFPYKFNKTILPGLLESQYGIFTILGTILLLIIFSAIFPGMISMLNMIVGLIIVTSLLLIGYGEFKIFNSKRQNA